MDYSGVRLDGFDNAVGTKEESITIRSNASIHKTLAIELSTESFSFTICFQNRDAEQFK